MKLEQWTLFIDMMGYGVINGQIKTEDGAREFIAFMKKNVELTAAQDNDEIRAHYESGSFNLYNYYDIKVIFVSDTMMISYYPKEVAALTVENQRILHSANALFIILNRLQIFLYNCMTEKKILVRGGVSNKFSLIDEQFAVGEGIIEAYQLESKLAIHPRIALSSSIIKNDPLYKAIRFLSKALYKIDSIVEADGNIYYLDYLLYGMRHALQGGFNMQNLASYQAFFLAHKETIVHHLEKTLASIDVLKKTEPKDEEKIKKLNGVLDKYKWMKNYHNRKMNEFKNADLIKLFSIE